MESESAYEEEEFHSEEELGFGTDDDDISQLSDGNDDEEETSFVEETTEENYKVLSEGDVQQSQEEEIMEVCSVLSVSQDSASILLRHSGWRANSVLEHWFSKEQKFRKAVGLLEKPVLFYPNSEEVICRICSDIFPGSEMHAAGCDHLFCGGCWKGYISTAIHEGPGCLTLRCPDPGCIAAVGQSMVNKLVSDEDKEKYSYYLIRSYVEASKSTKWCPAPGCDYAVKFELGSENYDVSCRCRNKFCWNCIEDAHRPVDCSTVAKWMLKNSSEGENTEWLITNCKPCPKCKRSIEKNNGCMHMTCTPPCKYQFCWLCLGAWSEHGNKTGGFYACNTYAKEKEEGLYDEKEKRREMAKNSLEKYTHYYERCAANQSSRQKAVADLQKLQTVDIEKLSNIQGDTSLQLKFIAEAWEQIIECRRVLKWTYVYGYYLPEEEHEKTQLFEYLQGQAESGLECLHQCTEKDLQKYLDAKKPAEEFNEFHIRLTGPTKTTRVFFEGRRSCAGIQNKVRYLVVRSPRLQ